VSEGAQWEWEVFSVPDLSVYASGTAPTLKDAQGEVEAEAFRMYGFIAPYRVRLRVCNFDGTESWRKDMANTNKPFASEWYKT
jgi:hypothetical protein